MAEQQEPVRPEVVDEEAEKEPPQSAVEQPTKLMRIASMTRAMLEEVRQAPLDDAGRRLLTEIHERSVDELKDLLSADLLEEFNQVFLPLSAETASESEIRIAQAQLIGWMEGLFHGIQASLWSQQLAAQSQLAEMRKRPSLEAGEDEYRGGVYL